ncbi:hypothetical protein XENOCAPTIV_027035 [Xenoophorus captivus]|uniref:Uncharacterized protein n=1 Tax=Xenoophorus captivus TaxID=1517983 RepID=A0ABV0QM19_9TELE
MSFSRIIGPAQFGCPAKSVTNPTHVRFFNVGILIKRFQIFQKVHDAVLSNKVSRILGMKQAHTITVRLPYSTVGISVFSLYSSIVSQQTHLRVCCLKAHALSHLSEAFGSS